VTITLLDGGERRIEAARDGETFWLAPDELGWHLQPYGLCRGEVCIPAKLDERNGRVEAQQLARALGRPLALDVEEGVIALGTAAADRARAMRSLEAPDVTLPDLDGRPVSLAGFGGRKRLLLAWASW